ncbi:MAG: hypothetical protein ABI707_10705 [Ferruginibacter sp.]
MDKGAFKTSKWIQVSLINFCLVALAGITMRFKINFPLPFVNQKYLLHAHSHFAFTGWVALVLMALMVNYLQRQNINTNYKRYHWILLANCIAAYGMFFSFIAEGYAFYSITFSTLSIFVGYVFVFYFWQDINKVKDASHAPKWFKTALVIWAISSLGAFTLAWLMANHIKIQDYYFGAIYFFLHFQYNGWFLFVCFGLLFSYLYNQGFTLVAGISKKLYIIMAVTVWPAYFLSVLWLKLPKILHLIADIAGILQLLVLFYFIQLFPVIKKQVLNRFTATTKYLWIMAATSFILKIILQTLSVIPFFSHFAFSFRPIVIGYLHLSFLGIISFFILGYIDQFLHGIKNALSKTGVVIFVMGVLVQEIILMIQGLEALELEPFRFANMILFFAAILMGAGLFWICLKMNRLKQPVM